MDSTIRGAFCYLWIESLPLPQRDHDGLCDTINIRFCRYSQLADILQSNLVVQYPWLKILKKIDGKKKTIQRFNYKMEIAYALWVTISMHISFRALSCCNRNANQHHWKLQHLSQCYYLSQVFKVSLYFSYSCESK